MGRLEVSNLNDAILKQVSKTGVVYSSGLTLRQNLNNKKNVTICMVEKLPFDEKVKQVIFYIWERFVFSWIKYCFGDMIWYNLLNVKNSGSWPRRAWQCSWWSPLCSQSQNPCWFTFWYEILKPFQRLLSLILATFDSLWQMDRKTDGHQDL